VVALELLGSLRFLPRGIKPLSEWISASPVGKGALFMYNLGTMSDCSDSLKNEAWRVGSELSMLGAVICKNLSGFGRKRQLDFTYRSRSVGNKPGTSRHSTGKCCESQCTHTIGCELHPY